MDDEDKKGTVHYKGEEGGWGSMRGIAEAGLREVDRLGALRTEPQDDDVALLVLTVLDEP